MELAAQQQLLARLCTDRPFREAFLTAPAKAAAGAGFSVGTNGLPPLPDEQLRQFARLLRSRRLGEVGICLPLTCRALGPQFAELFKNYTVQRPWPTGIRAGKDAISFVRYLEEHARQQPLAPAWALSLARYEAARVEVEWLGQRFLIRRFPHAVKALLTQIATGSVPTGDGKGFSLAIWWHPPSLRRPLHWFW